MEALNMEFETECINQMKDWGKWDVRAQIGSDVYTSTYYWIYQDPVVNELLRTDPIWFISKFVSFGYNFFDPQAYRWIVAILIATKYDTSTGTISYPSVKDVIGIHDHIRLDDPLYIYDGNEKKEVPLISLQKHVPEEGAFKIADMFMRLFVYSCTKSGAYGVNIRIGVDNTYSHIKRMRNAFKYDSYTVNHMIWAYALCMKYDCERWFVSSQFPTKEEVIARYHRIINKKTNKLKSTRAFQYNPVGSRNYETYYVMD